MLYILMYILLTVRFGLVDLTTVGLFFSVTVSVLSVNVVTVLFINLAVLLKQRFTRINTCLCELIQWAGEETVGIYRQIATVKHQRQLIAVNYDSYRQKRRLDGIRQNFYFLCDFVDHFNSVYSAHTLVLVTFYVVIFIYESYYGFVGIMNVNKGVFGSVMWVRVSLTEAAILIAGFMVLIYFCSSTSCEVRLCTYLVLNSRTVPVIQSERDGVTVV
jgi:hypothetical protein